MRAIVVLVALAACGPDRIPPPPGDDRCPPPEPTPRGFRHTLSGIGAPRHAVNDVITAVGRPYQVRAKLAYGPTSKDLEDEEVVLLSSDGACGWVETIGLTDDDGWVRFERPGPTTAGARSFHVVVPGDGSRVTGVVHGVAPATPAVVFDVDGTLTTGDGELLDDLLGAGAEARPGAAEVATRWAEHGRLVVYLTGRPYLLRASTRRWLADHGFPPGPLFTTEDASDALPGRDRVGRFKRDLLRGLIDAGLDVHAAYGNASTDVCAYAEAGIAPSRTWITEPRGGCDGGAAPNAMPGYPAHLTAVPR